MGGRMTMIIANVTTDGFILTKEAIAHMKFVKGDKVFFTEAPGSGYRITLYNPAFERKMGRVERIMREDRNILRALAQ
jgi:hypothetical protein